MEWFKANYGKTVLLVVALSLAASSALLLLQARAFNEVFAQLQAAAPQGNKMPEMELAALENAGAAIDAPPEWQARGASLYVSKPYLVSPEGRLIDPTSPGSPPIHPPVPNAWFAEHPELDIQDPRILLTDSDGDKFTNLQEYESGADPTDAASSPPRYLLLRLQEARQVPNRLVFTSYTEDVVTINTIDIRQPSQFLEVGQEVRGTKFRIAKLEPKTEERNLGGSTIEVDISEVTLENTETGETFVLVRERITDLGEGFVVLKYLLDDSEIRLKRNEEFTLPPDNALRLQYKEVRDANAVIVNLETGEEFLVPPVEVDQPTEDSGGLGEIFGGQN